MDAGLAAIIGAVAGGTLATTGTLGAAFLTGRLQGRNHHEQWQRDGRRAAYSSLIQRTTAYQRAVDNLAVNAGAEPPDTSAYPAQVQAITACSAELLAAASLVVVEGPQEVARMASRLADGVPDLTDHITGMRMDITSDTDWNDGGRWAVVIADAHLLGERLKVFTTEAQKALNE